MRKFVFALIIILPVIWWFFGQPDSVPTIPEQIFFVVSADGPAQSGQPQEIIVTAFSRNKDSLARETGLQLSAGLEMNAASPSQLIAYTNLQPSSDGSYHACFNIPENYSGKASFNIFPAGARKNPAFTAAIQVMADNGLAVLPPTTPIQPGNWLSFRIALINRKTANGIFRQPIRVKMQTPAGHQTVNRVVQTDIHGTAVFTTHIHEHAAPGLYKFEFTNGDAKQSLEIPVFSRPEQLQLLNQFFTSRPGLIQPIAPHFLQISSLATPPAYIVTQTIPANMKMLSEIRCETGQAFLTYACPGSAYRQIEVWQNGQVIYNSDLQLAAGRISIPFPHPVEQAQPLLFKLWQINDRVLKIQEQAILPSDKRLTPAIALLRDAPTQLRIPSDRDFCTMFFSRPGITSISGALTVESFTGQQPPALQLLEPSRYAFDRDPERFLSGDYVCPQSHKRFFLVDNELNLGKYRFSTMKIWLDPAAFFSSVLAALRINNATIDYFIGEAECRAIRFNFLGIEDQAAELERLEGLIGILAELKDLAAARPDAATDWAPALARAIRRINSLTHVPDSLRGIIRSQAETDNKVGPFSPVLPAEIGLEKLMSALKPGGKVGLHTGERVIPMNLSGNTAVYGGKNQPGQEGRLERLMNLRSIPVIVELDFTDPDSN